MTEEEKKKKRLSEFVITGKEKSDLPSLDDDFGKKESFDKPPTGALKSKDVKPKETAKKTPGDTVEDGGEYEPESSGAAAAGIKAGVDTAMVLAALKAQKERERRRLVMEGLATSAGGYQRSYENQSNSLGSLMDLYKDSFGRSR